VAFRLARANRRWNREGQTKATKSKVRSWDPSDSLLEALHAALTHLAGSNTWAWVRFRFRVDHLRATVRAVCNVQSPRGKR
jgi:hypothetical protein